jgi:NTP pyrophosphatase (non-canonical NTP hydrolase)
MNTETKTAADITAQDEGHLVEALHILGEAFHANSREKGFWDADRNDGECVALIHSEASELLEALRHGNPPSDHIPGFSGAEEELADILIRVLEYGEGRGFRVAEAVISKHRYNRTRPAKHGGKKF